MKKLLLLTLLFITGAKDPNIIVPNVSLLVEKQNGTFLCWAASKVALLRYYGKQTNQYTIVKEHFRMKHFDSEMLNSPTYMIQSEELPRFLQDFKYEANISQNDIQMSLKKGHPVLVMYNNHASLLVGYTKQNQYYLMDTYNIKKKISLVNFQDLKNYHKSYSIKGLK